MTDTLNKRILMLVNDFKLTDGEMRLPPKLFAVWLKRVQSVPSTKREVFAQELLSLASKFHEEGGDAMARAIAQLVALAADVMGQSIEELRE